MFSSPAGVAGHPAQIMRHIFSASPDALEHILLEKAAVLDGNQEVLNYKVEAAKRKVWMVLVSLYNIDNPRIIAAQEMDQVACDNFKRKRAEEERQKSVKRARSVF